MQKLGANGPGRFSVVAHPEGLAEDVSAGDLVLVREALLDEASGVANVLGLRCHTLPSVALLCLSGWLRLLGHAHHLAPELADQLFGGLGWLADLEKRVLSVDTVLLALLAEVRVRADGAHVANADDRVSLAAIADDSFVAGLLLLGRLVIKIVDEHLAEAGVAVILNFLANDLGDSRELLGYEGASSIALAAG